MSEIPDGYTFAARVTTGFDGGWHELRGDVWRCTRCDALVLPAGREAHDGHHAKADAVAANLASLNEVVAEMTAKVSDDPVFTDLVREELRRHSHALGFRFQGD